MVKLRLRGDRRMNGDGDRKMFVRPQLDWALSRSRLQHLRSLRYMDRHDVDADTEGVEQTRRAHRIADVLLSVGEKGHSMLISGWEYRVGQKIPPARLL